MDGNTKWDVLADRYMHIVQHRKSVRCGERCRRCRDDNDRETVRIIKCSECMGMENKKRWEGGQQCLGFIGKE